MKKLEWRASVPGTSHAATSDIGDLEQGQGAEVRDEIFSFLTTSRQLAGKKSNSAVLAAATTHRRASHRAPSPCTCSLARAEPLYTSFYPPCVANRAWLSFATIVISPALRAEVV